MRPLNPRPALSASRITATVLTILLTGACDDTTEPEEITFDDVVGTYVAVALTVTEGGVESDMLAAGATISIILAADGTTTGSLFAPGAAEGGGDFLANLEGEFEFNDQTDEVTLTHDVDTFLRAITLTAVWFGSDVQLEGELNGGDDVISVVLR